jgi:hypothetical protein
MGEQQPEQEPVFTSAKDKVLYRMAKEDWSGKSSGDTRLLPGWFASLTASPDELPQIVAVFGDALDEAGLESSYSLVGHWIIHEAQDHTVKTYGFDTEEQMHLVYDSLQEVFEQWGAA